VDVGFYGVGYIPNAPMIELERRIHAVLHPDVESSLADFCGARGLNPGNRPLPHRWRNAKCDVQMLWSHIHHQRSGFVTRDGNFRKASKVPKLLELGAGQILGPNEAAELLKPAA